MDFTVRDRLLAKLGFADYRDYLNSEHWQKLRQAFLNQGNIEAICWSCRVPTWIIGMVYGQGLAVHHINYERLGNENFTDLAMLCKGCHEREHFPDSEIPKLKLVPCKYRRCMRPMLISDRPLDTFLHKFTNDLESAAEILAGLQRRKIGKRAWEKLHELQEHPLCRFEAFYGSGAITPVRLSAQMKG